MAAELDGGANDAALGPDGAVYVTNNAGFGSIDRPDGICAPHAKPHDRAGGRIARVDRNTGRAQCSTARATPGRGAGPNDRVVEMSGGFWFSGPGKADGDAMQASARCERPTAR